jgi:hypothetical protein
MKETMSPIMLVSLFPQDFQLLTRHIFLPSRYDLAERKFKEAVEESILGFNAQDPHVASAKVRYLRKANASCAFLQFQYANFFVMSCFSSISCSSRQQVGSQMLFQTACRCFLFVNSLP